MKIPLLFIFFITNSILSTQISFAQIILPESYNSDSRKKYLYLNEVAYIIFNSQLTNLLLRGNSCNYYSLFNSINVQQHRGTHFTHSRGSRLDKIGYYFEDVDVRSAFSGINLIRFIPEALGSISTGNSPSASQGNSNSVIHHYLKEPAKSTLNLRKY